MLQIPRKVPPWDRMWIKHVDFLFTSFFISYQDANASNDLPPLLQKSSVLRAASALGIVGEQQRSITFTPHKAWIPQATTVNYLVCILSSLGGMVLDGLMYVSFVSLTLFSFLRYVHCLLAVAFKVFLRHFCSNPELYHLYSAFSDSRIEDTHTESLN